METRGNARLGEELTCSRCGGQVSSMSNSGDEVIRSYAHPGAEPVVTATCATCRGIRTAAKAALSKVLDRYRKDPSEENHRAYVELWEASRG